ncbi:hypothetical protein TIFTF001_017544 [Ficus carica]|uniref:Uncharacterized protein n=1 Tax=Ficus carica TaxID=3494 RepID=A0AA88A582_FICCA|nr:hypothetical protein TIFTF001_017544 [Ficus carica]
MLFPCTDLRVNFDSILVGSSGDSFGFKKPSTHELSHPPDDDYQYIRWGHLEENPDSVLTEEEIKERRDGFDIPEEIKLHVPDVRKKSANQREGRWPELPFLINQFGGAPRSKTRVVQNSWNTTPMLDSLVAVTGALTRLRGEDDVRGDSRTFSSGCSFFSREAATGVGSRDEMTTGSTARSLSSRACGESRCLKFFSGRSFFGKEAATVAAAAVAVMVRREEVREREGAVELV